MEKKTAVIEKNYNQLFLFPIRQEKAFVLIYPCKLVGIKNADSKVRKVKRTPAEAIVRRKDTDGYHSAHCRGNKGRMILRKEDDYE